MKRGQALRSPPSSPIARRIVNGYWAGVLLFVASAAFLALRDHSVVPMWDESHILLDMYTMPFVDWLFSSQNGHLLPATRLFFAADYYVLDGQKSLLIAASFALLVLSSVVLWRALRWGGGLEEPLSRLLFGWITLAIFWSASVYNLLCGVCNANTVVFLFSTIALACLTRHVSRRRAGRDSAAALAFTLVAGVLASAGLAHGLAIWPALLAVALAARLPLRDAGVIAAAALLVGGLFTVGTASEPGLPPLQNAFAEPLELFLFTATLLGSALARTAGAAGWLDESIAAASAAFGIIGLAGAAAQAVWTWRRRMAASSQDLLALGIMAFAAAVSLGIGANRLFAFGPEQAYALRFFDWSALFWIGVGVACIAFARRGPGSFWVGSVVIAVTTVIMLATLPELRATLLNRGERDADAALAVLVGVAGPFERRRLYNTGGASEFAKLSERLRSERKSFFKNPRAQWIGQRLDALFSLAPRSRCQGEMDRPTRVRGSRGAQMRGWAWDAEKRAPPESIVLIGREGTIEGLGNMQRRTQTSLPDAGAPWKAWGTKYGSKVEYSAYGVIDAGRRVCHLAGQS